ANCKHAGFTLLEVTIVLLIMAGVMAIGWPRIRSAGYRADLKGAALTVRAALVEARDIAVRSGRAVQFICRLDSSEFHVANALTETDQQRLDERPRHAGLQTAAALKSGSISGDVVFYRDPADASQPSTGSLTVTFFPDGRSTQTNIHLAFADFSHCIKLSVRGLTGGVSIHPVEKILVQDAAVRDPDPRSW
ncbi:MAG: prepilin-type N-terminal cleavage/methylation domain-containing protein, partial [Fuerstiella sp.]|nr:prepilin-type N-terminal cleavage/methylation domain-containing protein [Fuerstiella sp.]